MTRKELEDIAISLLMRRNYIQTGTITMSRNDAVAAKKHNLIKALEPCQEETCRRLESLHDKFQRAALEKSEEDDT